jgi:hypothetical protein
MELLTVQKLYLLYCNGAWCGQSPTAINALIELGYQVKNEILSWWYAIVATY